MPQCIEIFYNCGELISFNIEVFHLFSFKLVKYKFNGNYQTKLFNQPKR